LERSQKRKFAKQYKSDLRIISNFEILRKKARIEEEELKRNTDEIKTQTSTTANKGREPEITLQQQQIKSSTSYFSEQMNMMQKLMEKMSHLEKEIAMIKTEHKQQETTNYRDQQFGYRNDYNLYRGNYGRGSRTPNYGLSRRAYYTSYYDQQSHRYKGSSQSKSNDKESHETKDRQNNTKVEQKKTDDLNK
jgi:hypothetical protein